MVPFSRDGRADTEPPPTHSALGRACASQGMARRLRLQYAGSFESAPGLIGSANTATERVDNNAGNWPRGQLTGYLEMGTNCMLKELRRDRLAAYCISGCLRGFRYSNRRGIRRSDERPCPVMRILRSISGIPHDCYTYR